MILRAQWLISRGLRSPSRASVTASLAIALFAVLAPVAPADERKLPVAAVSSPPAALVSAWKLSPFYRKWVDAGGLPILASGKPSDYALLEARYLIDRMLADRDDIRAALVKNHVRFVVQAYDEMTTAIPENSDLTPKSYWDRRARGLGATHERPVVSCGEENLLCYPGDPYAGENILVHEFAHAIHEMGLRTLDPGFDERLKRAYDHAREKGLWKGTYAETNPQEYWAEGVQSWFDCNQAKNAVHNGINTREKLQAHDPELTTLIASVFAGNTWRYVRPDKRPEPDHLKGYDPAKAPRFAWPPELPPLKP